MALERGSVSLLHNGRKTCPICTVDGHSVCWDIEPNLECLCCVETMKQILIEDMEKR